MLVSKEEHSPRLSTWSWVFLSNPQKDRRSFITILASRYIYYTNMHYIYMVPFAMRIKESLHCLSDSHLDPFNMCLYTVQIRCWSRITGKTWMNNQQNEPLFLVIICNYGFYQPCLFDETTWIMDHPHQKQRMLFGIVFCWANPPDRGKRPDLGNPWIINSHAWT